MLDKKTKSDSNEVENYKKDHVKCCFFYNITILPGYSLNKSSDSFILGNGLASLTVTSFRRL